MDAQHYQTSTEISTVSVTHEDQTTLPALHLTLESFPLYRAGKWLRLVGLPVVMVFGTFGNVMAVLVLRRIQVAKFRAIYVYLTALAVVELVILYITVLWEWVKELTGFHFTLKHRAACKLFTWLSTCSGTVAAWLLVAVTSQRAFSVVWPHRVDVMCTRKASAVVIAAITSFLAVLYSHYLYGYDLILDSPSYASRCHTGTEEYAWFLGNVFSWVELFIFSVLPFACIAACNAVLVRKLFRSLRRTRNSMNNGLESGSGHALSVAVSHREREARSITLAVMSLSMTFIVLTLPSCVFYIMFYVPHNNAAFGEDLQSGAFVIFLYDVTYFLLDINRAVTFYLYCLTGSKFRAEFVKIITCKK